MNPTCRSVVAGLLRGGSALLVGLGAAASAQAAIEGPAAELVGLINDFRGKQQVCSGTTIAASGPLAPDERLVIVEMGSGKRLLEAVKRKGYQAERVAMIEVSGPTSAVKTMQVLAQHDCRALTDPRHAEIGVSRRGDNWRIVLARPLLSPDLADWPDAGRRILELVNDARQQARNCGEDKLQAAPPLRWDGSLADAAHRHSRAMARDNFFSHRGKDGSRVGDRADAAGYRWQRVGENIASGQGSTDAVVAAWLASPQHCANIMNPRFGEMGAAYAINPGSESTIYWTQVFGTPR